MKILIISAEVWRDDTNGGNVLSNLFSGFDAEFVQIYCNPGTPKNNICKKYFQMTDSMIINNLLKRRRIGRAFGGQSLDKKNIDSSIPKQENKKFYNFFRKYNLEVFYLIKELMWKLASWKNDYLESFITEFAPDVIFAPCYGSHAMLSITRYISTVTGKPIVSYISDDHYSLKQFRLSILFWCNRFFLRRNLRHTFNYYNFVYTMTQEQLEEFKRFKVPMKILRKGVCIDSIPIKHKINTPIKIVYAGGIYCGRWKTLQMLVDSIKQINGCDEPKIILDIYTGNNLTSKQKKVLNDGRNSFVHGVVSQTDLKQIYTNSDVALHVESFDLKYRLLTRLSFSTKIIDCLSSGCAVMAIAWINHSGLIYLKQKDAAIIIDDKDLIWSSLNQLLDNTELINIYADKAYNCCKTNHNIKVVQRELYEDFNRIIFDKTGLLKQKSI